MSWNDDNHGPEMLGCVMVYGIIVLIILAIALIWGISGWT